MMHCAFGLASGRDRGSFGIGLGLLRYCLRPRSTVVRDCFAWASTPTRSAAEDLPNVTRRWAEAVSERTRTNLEALSEQTRISDALQADNELLFLRQTVLYRPKLSQIVPKVYQ